MRAVPKKGRISEPRSILDLASTIMRSERCRVNDTAARKGCVEGKAFGGLILSATLCSASASAQELGLKDKITVVLAPSTDPVAFYAA